MLSEPRKTKERQRKNTECFPKFQSRASQMFQETVCEMKMALQIAGAESFLLTWPFFSNISLNFHRHILLFKFHARIKGMLFLYGDVLHKVEQCLLFWERESKMFLCLVQAGNSKISLYKNDKSLLFLACQEALEFIKRQDTIASCTYIEHYIAFSRSLKKKWKKRLGK